jgi:NADH-quinone oxidoreductase subunit I
LKAYFRDLYKTIYTILVGLRITLKYHFARPITLQYPDIAPALQPRFRGFHYFEIEKCIACDMCAKACPVDCIYIEKSGPRKIDKESGIARGGALQRFGIDYAKCMFCALCIDPCPVDCIFMGSTYDQSCYSRDGLIVDFAKLPVEVAWGQASLNPTAIAASKLVTDPVWTKPPDPPPPPKVPAPAAQA